jgi:hypothetical protein
MDSVKNLFNSEIPLLDFTNKNVQSIPEYGSIIYTIFLDKKDFIYVGIGGLSGDSVVKRDPRGRIKQHTQGNRSGDQFCIYIQDFYVIPQIMNKPYVPKKRYLDTLTKEFIQTRLSFRYIVFQTEDSITTVRRLEKEIQSGLHSPKPLLNPLG